MSSPLGAAGVFERDTPRYVESATGRLPKYPARRLHRWALRLSIALFYAALALWWNHASGGDWTGTDNVALAQRVLAIDWGGSLSLIVQLYPPITTLLAVFVPGGALGLAIAGSLSAGITLQVILQWVHRRRFPLSLRLIFVVTIGTSPLYTYVVLTHFEAAVALMFFAMAMVDLVRFVTRANTQAGFRAGLLAACASFSDPTTTFAALVAAIGAGMLTQSRTGARTANALVVAFPTIAISLSVVVLGAALGGGPRAMVGGDVGWGDERALAVLRSLGTPLGLLSLAPLMLIILVCLWLGFPRTVLVAVLLPVTSALAFVFGLIPPGDAGVTYLSLLLLLTVAVVPPPTGRTQSIVMGGAAVLLWIIGWLTALQWAVVRIWMHTFGGVG